jgi:hypothetical protein
MSIRVALNPFNRKSKAANSFESGLRRLFPGTWVTLCESRRALCY